MKASKDHEDKFRETWKLKDSVKDDPECIEAYEYAAMHKLNQYEIDFIGAIITRK